MAVPLVLVLVVLLSILAAGALTVTGLERRSVAAAGLQADAYALARAGLDRFVTSRTQLGFTATPPAASESTRIALLNGYADVILSRVRPAQGIAPALYVVRSRGVRTDNSSPPQPIAFRTIAQVARWQDPRMQVLAAWSSLRGVTWRNAAGDLNGFDGCAGGGAVAGVAIPDTPGYSQVSGPPVPNGAPDELSLGSPASAPDSIRIDWARLRAGGVVPGEVVIPRDPWPPSGAWADPDYWPIIIVQGDLTLPTDGRGLLVVTGDLTLPGGRWWNGVVLTGGRVVERAGNRVHGAIVTGLDRKLGGVAAPIDSVWGNFRVQYNSCNVARALASFRGLAPYGNTTVDNIP
jgi:hypothetical protein